MTWTDTPTRYGAISRALHWAMAALFAWQFAGMLLKFVLGRVPLMKFWVGTHSSIGTLLLILLALRLLWALAQRRHRPAYAQGALGRLAALGHVALYVLMLVVPALAVLRMFGNGRAIELFGITFRPETGQKIEWMVAPASLLHGILAWVLLALIAGHVLMVILHRYLWRDDVLPRMLGSGGRR